MAEPASAKVPELMTEFVEEHTPPGGTESLVRPKPAEQGELPDEGESWRSQKTVLAPGATGDVEQIWLKNLDTGEWYTVGQFPAVVGREAGSHVLLDHQGISRHHASIMQAGGGFAIEDNGSLNGLTVNGHQVDRVLLGEGDAVSFGPVRMRIHFIGPTDDAQPNVIAGAASKKWNKQFGKLGIAAISLASLAVVAGVYYLILYSSLSRVTPMSAAAVQQAEQTSATAVPMVVESAAVTKPVDQAVASAVSAPASKPVEQNTTNVTDPVSRAAVEEMVRRELAAMMPAQLNRQDAAGAGPVSGGEPAKGDSKPAAAGEQTAEKNDRVSNTTEQAVTRASSTPAADKSTTESGSNAANSSQDAKPAISTKTSKAEPAATKVAIAKPVSKKQKRKTRVTDAPAKKRGAVPTERGQQRLSLAQRQYLAGRGEVALGELQKLMSSARHSQQDRTQARQLHTAVNKAYADYLKGKQALSAGDKDGAFRAWQRFLTSEQNLALGQQSTYAREVNREVVTEYIRRGDQAHAEGNTQDAYRQWERAAQLAPKSSATSSLAALEQRARTLYREGYRMETASVEQAKGRWQEVVKLVPPGSEYHTKARAKLLFYDYMER